jgi:uncharacterized iron-regulated membrane protein
VFVDPNTGVVLGKGATTVRDFFHLVTDWHRWLGRNGESREIGRAVTGACNAAFVVLVMTGFYLWWPRRWTRVALKTVIVPSLKLRGKPRDWNWHNAVGFWSAPVLLFITLTGLVISYPWASNLIYTLTGSEAPPQQQRASQGRPSGPAAGTLGGQPDARSGRQPRADVSPAGEQRGRTAEAGAPGSTSSRADLDALFTAAERQAPHWRLMSLRLPPRGASQMTVIIEETASRHPSPRSMLTLNAATAAVVTWEPYAGYNLGRTIRFWVRWVHTGDAGGIIVQCFAALASAGSAVLVFTGLALAWRRFFNRMRRVAASGMEAKTSSPGITLPDGGGSTSSI